MKILVCISHVPDTTSKINFVDNNTRFDTTGIQFIIGPYDDYALARAIELKESLKATVTVLNVGTEVTEPTIRKALAIGADDAIRVNAEPVDSHFVARQIADQASRNNYDLILMGRESIDYNSGIVHGLVGSMLGIPSVSPVMKLDVAGKKVVMTREIEGGKESIEATLPLIAGCQEPIAEWKIPSMRGIMSAKTKPLSVVEAIPVDSYTEIRRFELPPPKGGVKIIDPDRMDELVTLLKNEAKVI